MAKPGQRRYNGETIKISGFSCVSPLAAPSFDEAMLRSYDVVLLNSHHMKHSLFYKIRRNQQRLGFRIIYID